MSLIPSIIAGLIALGVAYTENEAVKISGQNDLFRTEQGKILETLNLPSNERMSLLCAFHHSKLFEHQDIVENIYNTISNDPGDCTSGIYTAKKEDISASPISNTDVTVPDCVRNSGVVTTSCRAYDKSGFHSRPSASCQLTLEAGEGQFFAQQKVTVL